MFVAFCLDIFYFLLIFVTSYAFVQVKKVHMGGETHCHIFVLPHILGQN